MSAAEDFAILRILSKKNFAILRIFLKKNFAISKKSTLNSCNFQQQQTAWNGKFQACQLYEKNYKLMFFLNQMTEFITDISGNDGMAAKTHFGKQIYRWFVKLHAATHNESGGKFIHAGTFSF